jgi:hypothetical protein
LVVKMRTSSIVVAAVASLFFLSPAQAQYEGLSKFHWKRFIDKNEKQTAALIAADLAQAGAEQQVADALASARLAHFQDRIAAVEPIDLRAHEERVQLSAVTVTMTSSDLTARMPIPGERDALGILAAKIADRETMTTGSTRRDGPVAGVEAARASRIAASSTNEPWWTAPIFSFLAKLGW